MGILPSPTTNQQQQYLVLIRAIRSIELASAAPSQLASSLEDDEDSFIWTLQSGELRSAVLSSVMARWSAVLLLLFMSAAASAQRLPGNAVVITDNSQGVIHGKKNSKFTCTDTKKKKAGCMATCPNRCPTKCLVLCPTCKTFCLCDFYPGVSCGDPRFTGGDGNNFYFHGRKDEDFCILSDANLHINAHFIGKRNAAMSRDFTWIQALGVLFGADHALHLGANHAARWDPATDHLNITFDDERVVLPPVDGARWSPASAPALSVTRTAQVNTVVVELKGVFRIMANAVPITAEDSRIHNYGVTDGEDCLVHLDLGFKFHALTDDVHGVLGQTYRADYVNKLNVTAKMPVMGGTDSFVSSGLFATDCAVARFGRKTTTGAGIAMVTDANN